MRILPILIGLSVMWGLPLSVTQAEEPAYSPQKVVYHVNFAGGEDNRKYTATLRNIQNHINALGADRLDLRVVMNGNGLGLLQEGANNADLGQRISNLKSQGIQFHICRNTMTGRGITLDDLYGAWDEDIVPSGVAEVGHLQAQGYSYVKTY
jgi:hypothetical protein